MDSRYLTKLLMSSRLKILLHTGIALFAVHQQRQVASDLLAQLFVDVNPFLFRGLAEGAMVRLSASPIVNVTSGGGETGFFVLEEAVTDSEFQVRGHR